MFGGGHYPWGAHYPWRATVLLEVVAIPTIPSTSPSLRFTGEMFLSPFHWRDVKLIWTGSRLVDEHGPVQMSLHLASPDEFTSRQSR